MNIKHYIAAIAVVTSMPALAAETSDIHILPQPYTATMLPGKVAISFSDSTKTQLANPISYQSSDTLGAEAYILEIKPEGITITSSSKVGKDYALATLQQIAKQAVDGQVPAMSIYDKPRFGYRGFMLDVTRCYLPIEEIKKFVDIASQLKINNVHLHLTDDNGWRMEIKKYPKLTEVGAWRVDRDEIFPARLNAKKGEAATYGGYYTQDQLRDLVDYAARRNIRIIPEIEMPAHAIAAIASYPELACAHFTDFIGVLPGIGGKAASIIMCAGRDSTLQFVKDVLDEVMEVFPSEYIHLGGDEANKSHWEKCELCTQRMHDLGLADYEELQGWFMDQINSYVRCKGRTAVAWDEATYGKPKEDIIIMGWQGHGNVAIDYARNNPRKFIMTPALHTYLIRYQGPQEFEPFTYFGNITLKDVYDYDPVKADWTPEMRDQLMGIQASMWTEFCRTPQDVQYMVFPRLLALADAAWRQADTDDWHGFLMAADNFLQTLDDEDVTYAKSMYNIQHTAMPTGDGSVTLSLDAIRDDAHITYSINGDTLDYNAPITISENAKIVAQAHHDNGAIGKELALDINFNKATGRTVIADSCSNALEQVLTNGLRGSLRNSDFEWATWRPARPCFTVDLGEEMPISSVKLGMLANASVVIAFPQDVTLWIAGNDNDFKAVSTYQIPKDEIYPTTAITKDVVFDNLDTKARYIRITATPPVPIPDGMAREGALPMVCFDEIIVE